jgi:hypothetical protein
MKKLVVLFTVIALLFAACGSPSGGSKPPPGPQEPEIGTPISIKGGDNVTEITFTGKTQPVNFTGLSNNDIFMVKVNASSNNISAANTGGASFSASSDIIDPLSKLLTSHNTTLGKKLTMGHPAAARFQANPPMIPSKTRALPQRSMSLTSTTIGSTHQFWIDDGIDDVDFDFKQYTARLAATGAHSKIWVVGNSITDTQAQTIAGKFDIIYPVATNILGYEYGGGPDGDGGADGVFEIQILVYDIGHGIGGYFAPWDTYTNEEIDTDPKFAAYKKAGIKSNVAEIFYLDSTQVVDDPGFAYSTLVHELQHMINWNVKYLKNILNSETWYNEMLSMMAEDVIASHINITLADEGHVINARIPFFFITYEMARLTIWNNSLIDYSQKYAYGAFLLRNYGGAELLQEIMANNLVNEASITAALGKINGSGVNFDRTLMRFPEVLIYTKNNPGVITYNRTVTKTIGSFEYTSHAFNVWDRWKNLAFITKDGYIVGIDEYVSGAANQIRMLPYIFSATYRETIPGHSFTIHSHNTWFNKTGNLTVNLTKPANSNVKFVMMID